MEVNLQMQESGAVQIMTIHKEQGSEFPISICIRYGKSHLIFRI